MTQIHAYVEAAVAAALDELRHFDALYPGMNIMAVADDTYLRAVRAMAALAYVERKYGSHEQFLEALRSAPAADSETTP